MKKNIVIALALMLVLCTLLTTATVTLSASADNIVEVQAKSALLMDFNTGTVLYNESENDRLPIASMTKIMTLLLAFEEIDEGKLQYDEKLTISENAMSMGGSQVFLEAGKEYLVSDLIKSVVVSSANDSAVALAEYIGGSVSGFVAMMNEKAKNLNMTNTNFVNPTGLPQEGAFSSALDTAIMARELLNHKDFFKFSNIWMDKIAHGDGRITEISNTNKLLKRNCGVDGGKTGFTSESRHCVFATSVKQNMRLISVIIGSNSSKERFNSCQNLLDYGYAKFENKLIAKNGAPLDVGGKISKAKVELIYGTAEKDIYELTKKRENAENIVEIIYNENLKPPIKKGEVIGIINIYKNNTINQTVNIVAIEDVEKRGLFDKVFLN